MKRGLAIFLGLVVVLIVIVAAGAFYFLTQLDSIAKATIENIGSKATQTQVTLKDVSLSPFDGEGALAGFRMSNPAGFSAGDAFKFNEISVAVDMKSLFGSPVIIKRVLISKPDITYEIGPKGSNLEAIQKNVASYLPANSSDGGGTDGGGSDKKAESDSPDVIIRKFTLDGAKVSVVAPQFSDKGLTGEVPAIELRDIGTQENGISPAEAVKVVLSDVLPHIISYVGKMDLGDISKQLEGTAKDALEKAGQKAIDDATSGGALEGAGEKAGDTLKNLLNNDN